MNGINPAAPHYIPWYVPSADGADPLMTVTAFILLFGVLFFGVFFFFLHSLPERLGHKKLQFEIVAILGLISLFTHEHLFWVIALVLALVDLPDFTTPLGRIATALETRPSTGQAPRVEAPGKETTPAAPEHET
jgi:multisubunit Na+/H+ antiporter MnhF subunit